MNIILPIIYGATFILEILLFIINPGVIYSNNEKDQIYCIHCKFYYPKCTKKIEHCFECGICVQKYDHHCGVVGKCVGKYNTCIFILFVLSSCSCIFSFYLIFFILLFKNGE
jgi:hypothetical protein